VWSPERHAALVSRLRSDGWPVVVTGGPDEAALTAEVAGPPRSGVHDLGGATDLAGLAETIASARAVVAGNTGPAHLAAALDTPVVSLYAPTVSAARWRPWRVPHVLLHVPVPCAGCRARRCPVAGHPCLERVSVEAVASTVRALAGPASAVAPGPRRAPALVQERHVGLGLGGQRAALAGPAG
jgi:ADP-heptose:LPS heptosyltransferase